MRQIKELVAWIGFIAFLVLIFPWVGMGVGYYIDWVASFFH